MNFGQALEALEAGKKVARDGWKGTGIFVFLVPGSTFVVNRPPLLGIYPEGTVVEYNAHVDMKTSSNKVVPWQCSQIDMLAKDWSVFEDTPPQPVLTVVPGTGTAATKPQ